MLHCCVCAVVVVSAECIVAKWCVLEQNELTLTFVCMSFKVMSTIVASIASKLLELVTSNLVHNFVWGLPSGHRNNFTQKVGVA